MAVSPRFLFAVVYRDSCACIVYTLCSYHRCVCIGRLVYIENSTLCVFRCLLRVLEQQYPCMFYVKFSGIAIWGVGMCVCVCL